MRRWLLSTIITLFAVVCTAAPLAAAVSFANPAFQTQWQQGEATTPNFWGPLGSAGPGQQEPYVEATGGQRLVQYFDKGRMELTNGTVTNGLLATEIVKGQVQVGNNAFQPKASAIPIAGDPNNPSPTYAQLSTSAASLRAPTAAKPGAFITVTIDAAGAVMDSGAFAGIAMTPPIGAYDTTTQHNVLGVFSDYRNLVGLATIGLAISEPFRANVKVAGQQRTVLVQVFERRALTYTASNDPRFQVEMGNIGAHYYQWRFGQPLSSAQPAPNAAPSSGPTGGTPPSNTLPTLPNGTPYRDQFGRFTTRYPMGWSVRVDADRTVNFLSPQAPPAAGINVKPYVINDDVTLESFRQGDYDFLLPRLKDYRQISDTKIMVGPYNAYKRVFTHTNDEGQFEEIVRYHIRAKGYGFVVNCFAAPQDEGLYMPLFDGTTGAIEPLGP